MLLAGFACSTSLYISDWLCCIMVIDTVAERVKIQKTSKMYKKTLKNVLKSIIVTPIFSDLNKNNQRPYISAMFLVALRVSNSF